MKKFSVILPLLFAPVIALSSCVYNNGINTQSDFTIKSISFNVEKLEIKVGNEKTQIIAVIEGEGEFDDTLVLSFKDEGLANVEKTEVKSGEAIYITGIKEGTTELIATAKGDSSKSKSLPLTILPREDVNPVKGVSLDKSEATLNIGETLQLTATLDPTDATNKLLTWSTSDEAVASVSTEGLVTGKDFGETTIKVTTVDGGFNAECKITVTKPLEKDGYYLVGTPNDWKANPLYQLSLNTQSSSGQEYMIKFTGKADDEFKVCQYKEGSELIYFDMDHTDSGVTYSIADSVEINYGDYGNIHVKKDGPFTLYFDLANPQGKNYKYWVDVGHAQ
ncbi:MAG: Ig-like domain-containing protein [Bacilli bacterium]|nr:Ig-like domain-containing protein [Bacilli bacterium]